MRKLNDRCVLRMNAYHLLNLFLFVFTAFMHKILLNVTALEYLSQGLLIFCKRIE